jgi:hypothetical protein
MNKFDQSHIKDTLGLISKGNSNYVKIAQEEPVKSSSKVDTDHTRQSINPSSPSNGPSEGNDSIDKKDKNSGSAQKRNESMTSIKRGEGGSQAESTVVASKKMKIA